MDEIVLLIKNIVLQNLKTPCNTTVEALPRKFPTARNPYDKSSIQRKFRTAKTPHRKKSMLRKFRTAKIFAAKILCGGKSYCENSYADIFYGDNSYGEHSGHARGHNFKLAILVYHTDMGSKTFGIRVVKYFSSLPPSAVEVNTLTEFESRLDMALGVNLFKIV